MASNKVNVTVGFDDLAATITAAQRNAHDRLDAFEKQYAAYEERLAEAERILDPDPIEQAAIGAEADTICAFDWCVNGRTGVYLCDTCAAEDAEGRGKVGEGPLRVWRCRCRSLQEGVRLAHSLMSLSCPICHTRRPPLPEATP